MISNQSQITLTKSPVLRRKVKRRQLKFIAILSAPVGRKPQMRHKESTNLGRQYYLILAPYFTRPKQESFKIVAFLFINIVHAIKKEI